MSVWTHVAAVFRLDSFRFEEPDFYILFGKACLYDDNDAVWDDYDSHPENYMPAGSEGSLEKKICVNPDDSCMAAYTISVFGDLRDFDDVVKIKRWFEVCCNRINLCRDLCGIRQAVITVECENGDGFMGRYEPDVETGARAGQWKYCPNLS